MAAAAEPFQSYAQNFEDIVLWRALSHVERGTYVDVGAFDPILHSVSWAFYRRGWRGVTIEPVPAHAVALRATRPEDVTIEAAAGRHRGETQLFAAASTGISTLVETVGMAAAELHGLTVAELTVPIAPLDELLAEAGLEGASIHFCSIDVEGSEADVLAGFELERWAPWILVVEATEPNHPVPSHASWEPRVLGAGYRFCLFDGLNRFYVHPEHADRLAGLLSYPACVFDEPMVRIQEAGLRADALEQSNAELEERVARMDALEQQAAHLASIEDTFSWRVTSPLRRVRGIQRRLTLSRGRPSQPASRTPGGEGSSRTAFAQRLTTAASSLAPAPLQAPAAGVDEALSLLVEALAESHAPATAKAWLSLVTVSGRFPEARDVDRLARLLRMDGPAAVALDLRRRFGRALASNSPAPVQLDVVRDAVVIDVSHTVSSDLHTGIQRVVRETMSHWLREKAPVILVAFEPDAGHLRRVSPSEAERLSEWREALSEPGGGTSSDEVGSSTQALVPWRCRFVVPELFSEIDRARPYLALASADVVTSFSIIGYDLIPMIAPETVADDVSAAFSEYLAVVKHADRISAISRSTARDFAAIAELATNQGLTPPVVKAHPLPADATSVTDEGLERARASLALDAPLVLAVGSHEPRKNHVALLEAANRLWTQGLQFQLLLIGGSGWKSEEFDELVEALADAGRPVTVRRRCTEEELWAAYRLARFTVFPSLLEGFGLPVAESLAVGTPVITSSYGSMGELAEAGGCLVVDPRSIDELESRMASLLLDDALLERLRREAAGRPQTTWAEYGEDVWRFLVEGRS